MQNELSNISNPIAYNDIESAILFKYRKKESLYVVASRKNDAYFFCKESFLPVVLEILSLFNGRNKLCDIKKIIEIKFPNIKSDKLIIKLSKSNLVQTNNRSEYTSEMARTSSKIKEFSINSMRKIPSKLISLMFYIGIILFILSILLVVYLMFCCDIKLNEYIQYMNDNSYTIGVAVSIIFGFLFIIFHEFSHILTGLHYKIYPEKIGLSMYLNFIPKYYVKSSGIYLSPRYSRILFHFAGPACNFIFFAFFSFLGYLYKDYFLYFIAFTNIQTFFINLLPFSLTDGYFIMSALLKTTNLRLDFTNALCLKKSNRFSFGRLSYFLLAVLYIVLMSWYTSFWIVGIINDYINFIFDSRILNVILCIIILLQIFITSNYKTRKIQKILP